MKSIEDAIQQKSFASEKEKALVNLSYSYHELAYRQLQLLRDFDVSVQQFNVLRILRGSAPESLSIKSIAQRMLDKTSNASRLVDKLVEKELAEQKTCEKDRRQSDVFITEKGMNCINRASQCMTENLIEKLPLSEEQWVVLNDLLDQMRE